MVKGHLWTLEMSSSDVEKHPAAGASRMPLIRRNNPFKTLIKCRITLAERKLDSHWNMKQKYESALPTRLIHLDNHCQAGKMKENFWFWECQFALALFMWEFLFLPFFSSFLYDALIKLHLNTSPLTKSTQGRKGGGWIFKAPCRLSSAPWCISVHSSPVTPGIRKQNGSQRCADTTRTWCIHAKRKETHTHLALW